MKLSIVITSSKEPKTIGRAISAFLNQEIDLPYELLVVAPDQETLAVARTYPEVKIIKDAGCGKPAAMNQAIAETTGDIIVFSDGDVFVGQNSVNFLIAKFKNSKVGAATGHIVPTNNQKNMFGYWAYVLTESFNKLRISNVTKKGHTICSGYLYAVRKKLLPKVPQNILAEDAFISLTLIKSGYSIAYEQNAKAFVKYPSNLVDWIKQKKRTAGRFYQLSREFNLSKTSNLIEEVFSSLDTIFLIRRPIHIAWLTLLAVMRIYIWFRIFFDFRLWHRSFNKTWQRVSSTK